MAENKAFLAVGEEAARGTAESTTVGYIPVSEFKPPKPDFLPRKRQEFRGEDTALGPTTELRMGERWEGEWSIPMFTEAGGVPGMIGTLLKHFFGKAVSVQNAATGQYAHMLYAVADLFGSANLGAKALTFNANETDGATLKNYPFIGGRVNKLAFKQEINQPLIMTIGCMGQKLNAKAAGLATPVFPAENLRLDYHNLTLRTGAVTRTGTAPDYTNLVSAATQIKPDTLTLEFERGMEDKQLLDGTTSPGKTNIGVMTGKLSFTLDWEDPASGFSSVDEYDAWLAASSALNMLLSWDTGTPAGTGGNHALIIDLPICNRLGGERDRSLEKDPLVTFEYDFHFDAAVTKYLAGILLKNTATTI